MKIVLIIYLIGFIIFAGLFLMAAVKEHIKKSTKSEDPYSFIAIFIGGLLWPIVFVALISESVFNYYKRKKDE